MHKEDMTCILRALDTGVILALLRRSDHDAFTAWLDMADEERAAILTAALLALAEVAPIETMKSASEGQEHDFIDRCRSYIRAAVDTDTSPSS